MKTITSTLIAIGMVCLFASCSTDEVSEIDSTSNLENELSIENIDTFSNEVLLLVNAHRATLELPPLKQHNAAKLEAMDHTAYMIQRNRISHDNFFDRSEYLKANGAQVVSENVAFGFRTAAEVLQGWLDSPEHKAEIEGNFTHSGISVAKNSNGIHYFTHIFVR